MRNKQNVPKEKALAYFDDFYQTIYRSMWPTIREAMLCETHKYVAVVNNFADTEPIVQKLQVNIFYTKIIHFNDLYSIISSY